MRSSSSSSSNIKIKSSPIDGDVLWMQAKHSSEHVWNGEEDRKLHIRRVVPTYQGEEEIPEEIISLLRQCGLYWIMKMSYLKINVSLINHCFDWKMEVRNAYVSHEMWRVYNYSSRCLSIIRFACWRVSLIGQTNLDSAELCEELLGVRLQEGELQGSVVKLSWLTHHFSHINNHDGNVKQLQRFTSAWILRFIGGVLFVDKSNNKVFLRYLQFLRDFEQCNMHGDLPCLLIYIERCEAPLITKLNQWKVCAS